MNETLSIRIPDAAIEFTCSINETVLSAALRQGHNLPHGCQAGGCGQCAATLVTGKCSDGGEQVTAREGDILTCQAVPCSDIELSLGTTPELMALEVKTLPAKVDSLQFLTPDIVRVVIRYPPRESFDFLPGQFINLHWQGLNRSYSIAGHSGDAKKLELHISAVEGGRFTGHVFNEMKVQDLLRFEGPMGAFYVRQNMKPLIFVAGGTGFAPVQAMIQQLINRGDRRQIHLYWANSSPEDFYSSFPEDWGQKYSHVHYVPVVSGEHQGWGGRRGRPQQAVIEDFDSLADVDVYACGAPKLVEATREACYAHGLKKDAFFADPFTPSS